MAERKLDAKGEPDGRFMGYSFAIHGHALPAVARHLGASRLEQDEQVVDQIAAAQRAYASS